MSGLTARCGGVVVFERKEEPTIKSRWTGDLEDSRKGFIDKMVDLILPATIMTKLTWATATHAFAQSTAKAEDIRAGFETLLDVFTAIAEPILWFYALTACIMIATKNKNAGFDRLKQVAYAYAGIALLPTFFSFLRWIAELLKGAISL